MYGGDWPVSELAGPYAAWLETLDWATANCTREERRKLFRDNGRRVYRFAP
jgi:predicted TIM-barrel fold metal-dependent hydrolase